MLIDIRAYAAHGLKSINEVEVDGQPVGEEQEPVEYSDNQQTSQEENNPQQDNQEQQTPVENNPQPQEPEQPEDGDEGTTDYTQNPDEGYNDDQGQEPPTQEEEQQPVDALKAQEEEMYSNLSSEQLDIKHRELKNRFLEMYDRTSEIIDRIGDVSVDEQNISTVEYISANLSKMRTMLSDYIDGVYQTKSYIENSINYNRFLAVLGGINKMLEEIPKKED